MSPKKKGLGIDELVDALGKLRDDMGELTTQTEVSVVWRSGSVKAVAGVKFDPIVGGPVITVMS